MNESEEAEEIETFPIHLTAARTRRFVKLLSQYQLAANFKEIIVLVYFG